MKKTFLFLSILSFVSCLCLSGQGAQTNDNRSLVFEPVSGLPKGIYIYRINDTSSVSACDVKDDYKKVKAMRQACPPKTKEIIEKTVLGALEPSLLNIIKHPVVVTFTLSKQCCLCYLEVYFGKNVIEFDKPVLTKEQAFEIFNALDSWDVFHKWDVEIDAIEDISYKIQPQH